MDKPRSRLQMLFPLLVLAAGLAACAGQPELRPSARPAAPAAAVPRTPRVAGAEVAAIALNMIGVPYRYGGDHPAQGFDCSGLVFYSYARTGIAVPRTSEALFKAARKISLEDAAHGDLVFFQDQEKLSHVGIYLGDGRFVHAPATGQSVSVSSLATAYYQQHLVAVARLLPD